MGILSVAHIATQVEMCVPRRLDEENSAAGSKQARLAGAASAWPP
jgi:hypothetical protein